MPVIKEYKNYDVRPVECCNCGEFFIGSLQSLCPYCGLTGNIKKHKIVFRVKVFDSSRYIDDIKTPLNITMRNASIIDYRRKDTQDLIDVVFDKDVLGPPRISTNHFLRFLRRES